MGGGDSTLTSGMAVLPESGAKKEPNKALEPTPTAVTPRAIEMQSDLKKSNPQSTEARVAPTVGVAHL
jgi:hypothetical protein